MIAKDILSATMFLACTSALTAALLFQLGATQVAVIELSVGAGLVTVLMVYAISVVGKDVSDPKSIVPPIFAAIICLVAIGIVIFVSLPLMPGIITRAAQPLIDTLWKNRVLDVWIQVVLLFAGVMGILGLLTDQTMPKNNSDIVDHAKSSFTAASENERTPLQAEEGLEKIRTQD
jgi:NADH:ubiquinone oxidoreductase subunit 6 (subunit J)